MPKITYKEFYGLKGRDETIREFLAKRPMSASEVAKHMGLNRTTASEYLNKLAKHGELVKRKKRKIVYFGLKQGE